MSLDYDVIPERDNDNDNIERHVVNLGIANRGVKGAPIEPSADPWDDPWADPRYRRRAMFHVKHSPIICRCRNP